MLSGKMMKPLIGLCMLLLFNSLSWAQNYQSFDASATNAWTASKWSASSPTNACVGTGLTNAFTTGRIVYLCTPNGTGSGAMGITIGGIIATENYTHSSPTGTLATGGTVATIDVASGKTVDLAGTAISTAAGTGFIKAGLGIYASAGGAFTGGFTVNAGMVVAKGVNVMGAGGVLTINGGTIAGSATRDFTGKYSNIVVNGDFTLGSSTTPALGTANLTFSNNMALGAGTTRTITIGGTGNYTLGGIISGSGSNLNIASTAAGTVILTGANTYNGLTTVQGGTLQLNKSGGGTLPSGNSLTVNSGATVLISTAQTLNNVTVDAGGTLIVAATLTITGTANINGTFQINQGGWATGGTWVYDNTTGTLAFNNTSGSYGVNSDVWWQTSNGPANVNVKGAGGITMNVARTVSGLFQTSAGVTNANNLTLNGTGKLNTGGFFAAIPVWGASSTLIYNTGGTFGRANEFPNAGNLPSNVQVSNNTTINYPNAGLASRVLTGNLTIDAGSAFYMDYGSPNPGVGTLTINNLVLNGNLSLGSQTGGDLIVKGNFTRTGTFAPVGRAVFFDAASGDQTLTGNTTFDYVIVDKAAGSVVLAGNMLISQVLTLTNGNINTASNKVNITNNATSSLVRTNGYVNGNLQRAINTGANTYAFPVGTAAGYTPASLAFTAVGGAGSISIISADAAGANYPTALSATKRLARNWTATNSGVTGITGSATFTYLPADLVGGAVSGNLKAYVYDGAYSYPTSNSNTSTTFDFNGLATVGEFGAGECGTSLAPTFTKTMASSCGGGADGTITVTPVGGAAPYTYSWSSTPGGFSGNTAMVTGLSPRDYTVVVTDAATCSTSLPDITIFQAFAAVVTNNGGGSSSCGNTGYILLYGSGGVQPFQYSLDNATWQSSNSFTGLAAGTYTGYIKDFGGCVTSKSGIVVTGAAAMTVTANTRPATACANNGVIELYRTGGVAPYTYSLDDVTYQGSNTFNNQVGNATYTGWVKDASGCKVSLTNISVGKASAITVSSTKVNTSACSNTGFIQVLAGGGTPGYTYSITGANGTYQASNQFTGLAAGSYDVWVQDSKGCKNAEFAVVIATDAAPTITLSAATTITGACNNSGSIQLFRTGGGVGPFTYSLDNVTYQGSNLFTGVAAGTYTGWVKDSRGCTGSQAGITVTAASAVSVTESHTNSSVCVNDGTLQLRPSGGVGPFTYSLDDVTYQASATFTGLAPTSYTGWAKDSKGCKSSVGITITSNILIVTAYVTDASDCATANGSIQLFRTGGFGPYTYSLDNVTYQSSPTFTGLNAGTYTGYTKDSKGCIGSLSDIEVGPPCLPRPATARAAAESKIALSDVVSVKAYPNPSAAAFNLVLDGFSNDRVSITVTDIMGRKVHQATTTAKQYSFGSNLKAGIYLVQVQQGDKKQNIKLVKE